MSRTYKTTPQAKDLSNYPLTPTARLIAVYMQLHKATKHKWPSIQEIKDATKAGERTFERAWRQLRAEQLIEAHTEEAKEEALAARQAGKTQTRRQRRAQPFPGSADKNRAH